MRQYTFKAWLILAFVIGSVFTGCKDELVIPDDLKPFLTDEFYQEMLDNGFVFNLGEAPPTVVGVYLFEPENIYDNSGFFSPGEVALDTKWKFSNQSGNALDVFIKNWTGIDAVDTSDATIIKGDGNNFTILAEAHGSSASIDFTYVYALTGEFTAGGISNAQFAFIMTENPGAPGVAEQGTIRMFKDVDALAETTGTFRLIDLPAKGKLGFATDLKNL